MYKTHADDRMVWVKNDDWWAKTALNLDVKPKYIVDIVNGANSVALGMVLQGGLDLSNNFLPGIGELVNRGYVKTYFPTAPYMLSANTAWLVTNDQKPPTNDPGVPQGDRDRHQRRSDRRQRLRQHRRRRPTRRACSPRGTSTSTSPCVDSLGTKYSTSKAKSMLADAGYKTGCDGFFTNKDGSPIKLTISVPTGWSDWEAARDIIVTSLKAAGINAESKPLDYNGLVDARNSGNFDLVINNEVQVSNTPWTYYDYMFRHAAPAGCRQEPQLRRLRERRTPGRSSSSSTRPRSPTSPRCRRITSKLQKIFLTDLPVIPLWYNGMWSQVSNVGLDQLAARLTAATTSSHRHGMATGRWAPS